jgi:glycosyltransferase involved in cell wall biosynthesis
LLFVGEFPPSNHHGGAILVRRLLEEHPAGCLTVITSKDGMERSQGMGLLKCNHIAFPILCGTRHPWLRKLGNCLVLSRVAFTATQEIRRQRTDALITIIQARYYLAAALASWVMATPLIAIVHDNVFYSNVDRREVLARLRRRCIRKILQHAAHIYVVSPEMQHMVWAECGREGEIQLPSTSAPAHKPTRDFKLNSVGGLVILFAGTVGYTVIDSLDVLAKLIASDKLKDYGIPKTKLHLCTSITDAEIHKHGWYCRSIVAKGWLSQAELARELSSADILFLPYSFSAISREAVKTAFPSKAADYLAAGKPIVVFGPKDSSLVRYASNQGFAEVVTEFSEAALAHAIETIASSAPYREKLAARALEVFAVNHDISRQRDKFYLMLGRIMCKAAKVKSSKGYSSVNLS